MFVPDQRLISLGQPTSNLGDEDNLWLRLHWEDQIIYESAPHLDIENKYSIYNPNDPTSPFFAYYVASLDTYYLGWYARDAFFEQSPLKDKIEVISETFLKIVVHDD